jgi:hypothetical protein
MCCQRGHAALGGVHDSCWKKEKERRMKQRRMGKRAQKSDAIMGSRHF